MTGLLKDTFTEEAESIGDPHLDLDAIVANGRRRIKRRRLGMVITAVAASTGVVAGGLTVVQQLQGGSEAPVASAGQTAAERRPTWADGNEIHFGSEVIRVSPAVASFVQVDIGFVYTSADGSVYRVVGRGTERIGKGNKDHKLAVDSDKSLVGWVDANPSVPEFVVYDVAGHREVARTAAGNKAGSAKLDSGVRVSAIDSGFAYFGATDGLHRWDLAKGVGQLIKPKAIPRFLVAADAGQLVWEHPTGDGESDLAVGTDVNAPDPKHFTGWAANISPQARFLLTDEADEVRLVDLRTGTTSDVKIPGYTVIVPTQWKGDHSFYAIGFTGDTERLDLLLCTITSAGKVTSKVSLSKFAPPLTDASTTQFPIGFPANK